MEKRHKNNSFRSRPTLPVPPATTTLLHVVEGKLIFKLLKKLKNSEDSERGYYK